jgi:protein-S-isoprenylcysteine O-methyltransferase Ste14
VTAPATPSHHTTQRMPQDQPNLFRRLWPNRGPDWPAVIAVIMALFFGAIFSGALAAIVVKLNGTLEDWMKIGVGAVGYGAALLLGILAGRAFGRWQVARLKERSAQTDSSQ